MNKILSPKQMMAVYKDMAARLLPKQEYKKVIPAEEITKELSLIRDSIDGERFFFVVNLHTMELEHVCGIQRWLGYSDSDFSMLDYLKIIHPAHAAIHRITSVQGIQGLMRGDWNIAFMKHRYITNIALKHRDGRYLLCKRLASVFQYYKEGNKNCLLEYINEFTIIGEYNEEPYIMRTGVATEVEVNWELKTLMMLKKVFEEENHFSKQELRTLRKYANDESARTTDVARALEVEPSTITTYNKRILEKAEHLFSKRFSNAKEVAVALRKQGLI